MAGRTGRTDLPDDSLIRRAEVIERDDLQKTAIRLFEELQRLHVEAKALPYDSMDRWRLSIKANKISEDLKTALDEQRMQA
jgi:hypothetical protein